MPTVVVKYTFALEVDDPTDYREVVAAVQEYVSGNDFALDNPDTIEVEA